jgi:hypothetical protein
VRRSLLETHTALASSAYDWLLDGGKPLGRRACRASADYARLKIFLGRGRR